MTSKLIPVSELLESRIREIMEELAFAAPREKKDLAVALESLVRSKPLLASGSTDLLSMLRSLENGPKAMPDMSEEA